ncbi:MAG TPA: hypothetical protein H9870_08215 [Candidatus Corynebacterium avicola]|uniref:Uncharacterized protein n=1 Tax=Candidatus Corynebacterium avicola TaxID=2838527 RepID=A0A9D1RQ02_9CORY|nr:hypothetical protein [Candidatus Corynebacterium avicola]
MPKYISRSTGEVVYPDQIRSGEVVDAVEVDRYPAQPAQSEREGYLPVMPEWTREETSVKTNPFGRWFVAFHVMLVLSVIGGMVVGAHLAGGHATFAITVLGGLTAGLAMVPLYLLTHIGSTVWQLKNAVSKSMSADLRGKM